MLVYYLCFTLCDTCYICIFLRRLLSSNYHRIFRHFLHVHGVFYYLEQYKIGLVVGMLKPFIFRNRFAETGFLPVTERPIVSGIIVTGRSALAISRSLVASRRP